VIQLFVTSYAAPLKKLEDHGYFKWSRKLNFFFQVYIHRFKPSAPQWATNILMKYQGKGSVNTKKGGDTTSSGILKCLYVLLILTFCWATKKKWPLGKNYFSIFQIVYKFQGDVTKRSHFLECMIQL
jgi:hypothetical protein